MLVPEENRRRIRSHRNDTNSPRTQHTVDVDCGFHSHMFSKSVSLRAPRGLVALILAITVVPLVTLLWLGWRLVQQDRALERQQIQQRVERAADLIVAVLGRAVSASEQRLAAGVESWPAGAVVVAFREDRKSTRLNSSHSQISYAVFCLK